MRSLDTETTGLDLRHGAKPFLVTSCSDKGKVSCWEWDVDPLTREPIVLPEDIPEIVNTIGNEDSELGEGNLVFQNAKFDLRALASIGIEFHNWNNIHENLFASHVLDSGNSHGLTAAANIYLGINIQVYEDRMAEAVKEARTKVKSRFSEWRAAKKGMYDMPSAKEKVWKFDTWLPKALAKELGYPDDHLWYRVTKDYANTDSKVTMLLWKIYEDKLKEKGLWELYLEGIKLVPIIYKMETVGITYSRDRAFEIREDYEEIHDKYSGICKEIAKSDGYDLEMPKGTRNKSLQTYCFGEPPYFSLGEGSDTSLQVRFKSGGILPIISLTEAGSPSLDKDAREEMINTLDRETKAWKFINNLHSRAKISTSLSYLDSYDRFKLSVSKNGPSPWYRLYSGFNPTGTATLRWSSEFPNSQQISKQKDDQGRTLRYCFGPLPGREWWSLDFDNLELRIPAYECNEPEMVNLFEHPNDPPYYGSYHLLIFDILHPKLFKQWGLDVKTEFKDTWYQWTKNGNFADQYGALNKSDGTGTADKAYHVPGAQTTVSKRLTKKAELNRYWIRYANEHGYVETIPDKTVSDRGYPLFCSRGTNGKILPTVPFNYHVQGTAGWVIRKSMIRVQEYLDTLNKVNPEKQYHMVIQVHDELVFDFPASGTISKDKASNLPKIKVIQKLMEKSGDDIGIPLTVGIDYHPNNWSESESL